MDEVLTIEEIRARYAPEWVLIGEPPNTCSFHFRPLSLYGFLSVAGPGPGRNRPWRRKTHQVHFTDVHEDPETALAAQELDRVLRDFYFERLERFYATRAAYPKEWQETTGGSEIVVHVTPDELRALDDDIMAILDRFRERTMDPARRPPGSLPIEVLFFAYPLRRPAS